MADGLASAQVYTLLRTTRDYASWSRQALADSPPAPGVASPTRGGTSAAAPTRGGRVFSCPDFLTAARCGHGVGRCLQAYAPLPGSGLAPAASHALTLGGRGVEGGRGHPRYRLATNIETGMFQNPLSV